MVFRSTYFSTRQTVEEVEQQRFRQLLSEYSLEADVSEGIDVFGHVSLLSAKVDKNP